jgi:ribosomal small subunit protein bTHX
VLYLLQIINNFMGRGDKKTTKGKRSKGSFGVSRNKKAIKASMKRASSKKPSTAAAEPAVAAKPKRAAAKKKGE